MTNKPSSKHHSREKNRSKAKTESKLLATFKIPKQASKSSLGNATQNSMNNNESQMQIGSLKEKQMIFNNRFESVTKPRKKAFSKLFYFITKFRVDYNPEY